MRFLLVLLFFNSFVFSQTVIAITDFDETLVEELILKKVNEERVSQKLSGLVSDSILYQAAAFHSVYQMKKKKMGHEQTSSKTKMPRDRVVYFNGDFKKVGENVAYTDVNIPVKLKIKGKTKVFEANTYEDIAELLFIGWKYSALHYKNMVDENFNTSGISVKLDVKNKRLYATQVFGLK